VPEICRFYGIVIKLFWNDHEPPHFHAEYGEHLALIDIRTLAVIDGRLPARALGLTIEWAAARQGELMALWAKARASEPLEKLEPLQ
jgi:hypothetical protein